LSPKRAGGEEVARPFDRRRNGPVLGEGGFTLLVESSSTAARRSARIYGEILGVGATSSKAAINDWPSDPAGPASAMQHALSDAGLRADQIDAVFATANGSVELDHVEALAIAATFGDRRVPVASIKGALGESGAGAAASLIAGLLSLPSGVVPPTVGWGEPDPRCDVAVSRACRPSGGNVFLVNSIASGGTNYALVARARDADPEPSNQL
jgi:3-oxoacyl-(acyl-carrier-protein) synthase